MVVSKAVAKWSRGRHSRLWNCSCTRLEGPLGGMSVAELLSAVAEAAFDLFDTLRSLYAATGFGVESLGGFVEVVRRLAAGDFHPAIIWPIYAADTPDKLAL